MITEEQYLLSVYSILATTFTNEPFIIAQINDIRDREKLISLFKQLSSDLKEKYRTWMSVLQSLEKMNLMKIVREVYCHVFTCILDSKIISKNSDAITKLI